MIISKKEFLFQCNDSDITIENGMRFLIKDRSSEGDRFGFYIRDYSDYAIAHPVILFKSKKEFDLMHQKIDYVGIWAILGLVYVSIQKPDKPLLVMAFVVFGCFLDYSMDYARNQVFESLKTRSITTESRKMVDLFLLEGIDQRT